jgi:anti-sigma factor (TIGR02949 family)
MPCRELIEVITEYLEGGLAPEDRTRFEEHLEACSACRMYLDQFEAVIRTLGRIEEEQLDPELKAGLVAEFSGWRG